MRTSALPLFLALGACASAPPAPPAGEITFACAGGQTLRVTFADEIAGVDAPQGTFRLVQQRSGSGFWYSDGRRTLRGKGDEVRWEFARMAPLVCQRVR